MRVTVESWTPLCLVRFAEWYWKRAVALGVNFTLICNPRHIGGFGRVVIS